MEHGLSRSAARRQAKALERERAVWLRQRDRARLKSIREALRAAKQRRAANRARAVELCRRARQRVRETIRALRAAERARINTLAAELKGRARAACTARKARIRAVGGAAVERRRAMLLEEHRHQAALRRATQRAEKQVRSSARERRQESDGAVRNNLPNELRSLWDHFKRNFPGGPRTTRTEQFLEWAEANPDEVLRLQSDTAEAEVRELVKAREGIEKRLAKAYKLPAEDLQTLERMGLAPNQVAARRLRHKLASGDVPF